MNNLFSAFQTEVFRPIVTLMIPGAIAGAPWLIGLTWQYPNFLSRLERDSALSAVVIALATVAIGMICENLGSHIETRFDGRLKEELKATWNAYLRTAFIADPVGRRYARTLVLRLKFELGVLVALSISLLGIIYLAAIAMPKDRAAIFAAFSLIIIRYLIWEAGETHKLLHDTRVELMKSIRVIR